MSILEFASDHIEQIKNYHMISYLLIHLLETHDFSSRQDNIY